MNRRNLDIDRIVAAVRAFDGALVVIPDEGGPFPEIAWGDAFFFHAPDGVMPERTQPYGTIVTKDYPDDSASRLDEPGRFRVNVHVGRDAAARLVQDGADPAEPDVFVRHPLYDDRAGSRSWIPARAPPTP
nr:DUF6194 family protein [Agromyces sp. LHK192]